MSTNQELQSAVVEDYLRMIYKIQSESGSVTTSELAQAMNVSSASASDMLKKLARKKFITYKPYYGAALTPTGRSNALLVTRRHRLWEMFLVKTLDFSWDEVHAIADKLEHATSVELERRIDEKLGFPTTDPHGDPIPRDGELVARELVALTDLPLNTPARIARVSDDNPEILQYLAQIGLKLEQHIVVKESVPFDNSLHIELDGLNVFLSEKLSHSIFVTPAA